MSGTNQEQHIPIDELSAYLDGEIEDPAEARRIRDHLTGCSVCRDELRQLKAVSQLLAELPEPDAPRSFRLSESDVSDQANAPVPIEPWFVRYQSAFRATAMAAVLLLAVVVAVDFWPERTGFDSQEANDAPVMMDAPQEESAQEAPLEESEESDDSGAADTEEAPESAQPEEDMAEGSDESAGADDSEDPGIMSDQDAADGDSDDAAIESEDDAATDESEEADPAPGADEPSDSDGRDQGEAETPQRTLAEEDSDGVSTLRIVMTGLAIVSAVLLMVGFVIPRWWRSSARGS